MIGEQNHAAGAPLLTIAAAGKKDALTFSGVSDSNLNKHLVDELEIQVAQTIIVETLCNTTKGKKSPAIQFDNIFKHLLAHLAGPIMKFSIDISGLESWPVIHEMTYFLSRNGIQHLVLKLPLGFLYELPYSVYSCLELKHFSWLLEQGVVPTRLPFNLDCVRRLYISGINLGEFDAVSYFLCLIRSFPSLQFVQIEVNDNDDEVPALEALEVECFADVTFKHLKEVELKGSLRTKPQMQLIKLLLLKSPVLVKMLIMPVLKSESLG
ncbi:hypothetical protein MTR67_023352 [Solanum verrucosum]|uniref:FBD domain-containing protein n=1 Tax=Solanum verrucosum TaxID=315347 RepID=A0AAF0QTC6_SOLVR|nr:hypothetical protein MTR67_023352 [Solanum verrucosum]